MSTPLPFETIDAKRIMSVTLVGVHIDKYPIERGNCFSVTLVNSEERRVLNFAYENLKELERLGLTWPIKVTLHGKFGCLINDERIGDRWYSRQLCEVCTPREDLPIQQRMAQHRQICRGQRQEYENGCVRLNLSDAHNPQFP